MSVAVTEAEEKRYAELQLMALDFARKGESDELWKMIRAGLPVNLEDTKGNTLLMLASYYEHLETVDMLLVAGAEVDRRNHRGQTPLGGVAFKGYLAIVTRLLDAGADIEADNGNGMTPLMFATMFGRTQVAELLKQRGANIRARNRYGLRANALRLVAPFFKVLMRLIKRPSACPAA